MLVRECQSGQMGYVKAVVDLSYGGSNPPSLIVRKPRFSYKLSFEEVFL